MRNALAAAGADVRLVGDVLRFPFADLQVRFEIIELLPGPRAIAAHLHMTLLSPEVLATPLCDCWMAITVVR